MYKKNLIIAGSIAFSIHTALVMMSPNLTSEPEVIFRKGESSLKMNLVPSVASTASTKSIDDIREEVHKVEEKKIDNPEPVKKPEKPKVAPVTSAKPVIDLKEAVRKVEDKIIENSEPLKKTETSEVKQVKAETKKEQQEREITYNTEYFKTQKKVNKKQPQVQKEDTNAIDSKEIIADIKEKGVTTGASIKNVFKPRYPSTCKRRGHEGVTVLEVTILSSGKCANITIIKSAGCNSLDKAARKALKKADFIPARRLGIPFTITKKIAFSFKLEDYK